MREHPPRALSPSCCSGSPQASLLFSASRLSERRASVDAGFPSLRKGGSFRAKHPVFFSCCSLFFLLLLLFSLTYASVSVRLYVHGVETCLPLTHQDTSQHFHNLVAHPVGIVCPSERRRFHTQGPRNLPQFLPMLGVGAPSIWVFFDIFIGKYSLECSTSVIEVKAHPRPGSHRRQGW